MRISQLDERVESGLVSLAAKPGHWRTVPYEAEGFSGVMLACGHGTRPEPVRLRLEASGPHRIWVGLFAYSSADVRLRLTDDLCCTRLSAPARSVIEPTVLHEVLWKDADLTGQNLFLEGACDRGPLPGALAYVRLEPVAALPAPAERCAPWRGMCVSNDGCGVFRSNPHHRPEDILEDLEDIPDASCARSLLWGNGNADNCNYPTEVGNPMFLQKWEDPYLVSDAIGMANGRLWEKEGWDSMQLVRDYARKRQWEFHVYIRMEAFAACYPHEDLVWSEFFYAHPEWWCLDREGNQVNRLSYACPEVQEHMLDLISEILSYDPDGICLCLTRGIPLVLYEPMMVAGFRERHGVDPRTLDELDPRWLDYQAEVLTSFVRRAKGRTGEGQRLSVLVPGNEADCRKWGIDVATWVREGIIDDLYPVAQRFNAANTHFDAPDSINMPYFQGLVGRERIRLIPCFYSWSLYHSGPTAFRQLVRDALEQGADQYCIWDGHVHYDDRKIGDIGLRDWGGAEYAPASGREARTVPLFSLGGFRIHEYGGCEVV
jgi:hypothetical protein